MRSENAHLTEILSAIQGMVWRKDANKKDFYSLEATEETYGKHGTYFRCFGDVEKKALTGKYATLLPKPYDEETDSDAFSVGEFETLKAAMEAVEASASEDQSFY